MWEMVIGLEVHAQIISESKLFSSAPNTFGGAPNEHVSFVDAAFPGMLPVLNEACVRQAVRTGLALGCVVHPLSVFSRKNYFYPDLPQGYQISQDDQPLFGEGELMIHLEDGTSKKVGIERLHVEQDAGKSLHDQHPSHSYIDLNRSGIPLMEIVSKPDMRSPEEAVAYVSTLRTLLQYIETCDGHMQEGSLRADANVSVRRPGDPLGTRCEIKNLNSLRFLKQAIVFESKRQISLLENGKRIEQETRLFDHHKGETHPMRSKEDAQDYRYFPEPDLLPLVLDQAFIDALRSSLPELPDQKRERFIKEYALRPYDSTILTAEREKALYYEEMVGAGSSPVMAARWMMSELFGALNKAGISIAASPVSAPHLASLLTLIEDGTLSGKSAKEVFATMFETGRPAQEIVKEKGLTGLLDPSAVEALVTSVLADHPTQLSQYKEGKLSLSGWFVGQVMKRATGQADPKVVNEKVRQALKAACER